MASLKVLLGMFPQTAKIEETEAALIREFKDFKSFSTSDELEHFVELEQLVTSPDFKEVVKTIKAQKFKDTEEYAREREYRQLKKSAQVKKYLKAKQSSDEEALSELGSSEEVVRYNELEDFVNSDEFKERKEYMALSPKKKYEQSDEYKAEQEYLQLKKSEKIVWYQKLKGSHKFDKLKRWKKTFEDDFNADTLNEKKWITRYMYGDKFLNDSYVNQGNQQCFTDGKNIEINNSVLSIITRREDAQGKVWTPDFGFLLKDFQYTSDVINTSKSFKQLYGVFKAKVRISASHPVMHAFWMLADRAVPHINIFKSNKSKLFLGNYWGGDDGRGKPSKGISKMGAGRFTKDFFIYTLEWGPSKLVWKINDLVVYSQSQGVPSKPMYIAFASLLESEINNSVLPASLDIDWVRCYKEVKIEEEE